MRLNWLDHNFSVRIHYLRERIGNINIQSVNWDLRQFINFNMIIIHILIVLMFIGNKA